jgi:hypothetical protein
MMPPQGIGGGIRKLSELLIDSDKDWGRHNITNFGSITLNDATLASLTADPTLATGKIWFRSDLGLLGYSPDGTTVRRIPYGNRGVNVSLPSAMYNVTITLPYPEPDTNYGVLVSPTWNTTVWITSKTTTSFTVQFSSSTPIGAKIDWLVYR